MTKLKMRELLIQKLRENHSLKNTINKLRREWSLKEKEIEELLERLA